MAAWSDHTSTSVRDVTGPIHGIPSQEWSISVQILSLSRKPSNLSRHLARPQSDRQRQCSPSPQLQPSGILLNASPLLYFSRETLALIASYLPLQSALNLHAISQRLFFRLPFTDTMFWLFYTLRLHSSWLWDLHNPSRSSFDANWKALLHTLTMTRCEIIAGAIPYGTICQPLSTVKPETEAMGMLQLPLRLLRLYRHCRWD